MSTNFRPVIPARFLRPAFTVFESKGRKTKTWPKTRRSFDSVRCVLRMDSRRSTNSTNTFSIVPWENRSGKTNYSNSGSKSILRKLCNFLNSTSFTGKFHRFSWQNIIFYSIWNLKWKSYFIFFYLQSLIIIIYYSFNLVNRNYLGF